MGGYIALALLVAPRPGVIRTRVPGPGPLTHTHTHTHTHTLQLIIHGKLFASSMFCDTFHNMPQVK